MKFVGILFAAAVSMMVLSACTASVTACNTMESLKISFDEFAAQGEFDRATVRYVNQAYGEGARWCAAPAGYNQADVIAAATRVALVIRREMREEGVAYRVMGPKLDKLEGLLRQAKQQSN